MTSSVWQAAGATGENDRAQMKIDGKVITSAMSGTTQEFLLNEAAIQVGWTARSPTRAY